MRRRRVDGALALLALLASLLTSGCVSVGVGGDTPAQVLLRIDDPGITGQPRRDEALVESLLIQPLPADAIADSASIAYSRRPNEFAFYQLSSWAERPVRRLPQLLKNRLEARNVAAAVGLLGEPIAADWLLTLRVDALYHDVSDTPGQVRLALSAELIDRRTRTRVARRQFATDVATTQDDAAGASAATSKAVALTLDALLPWLEAELTGAAPRAPLAPH